MNYPKKVAKATYRDVDRISELPEPLILHIQSFLPLKDAARSCILSKTWKDMCSLYPILYFDHNLFGLQFLLSHTCESGSVFDSSQQIHEIIMDSFLDFVDCRLSRVIHENVTLRKLGLSISVAKGDISKYSSHIDHWMELVTEATCVQELCFSVQITHEDQTLVVVGESYNLMLPILASTKGLQVVSLRGCALEDYYTNHNTKIICSSLRQIYMSKVIVRKDAWNSLACCCPFIEIIELDYCYTFIENLEFSRFPMSLKEVSIDHNWCCERVIMTATNLESLKYDSRSAFEMDVAACSCIRALNVRRGPLNLLGKLNFYQDFTTIFPVLEEASILVDVSSNGYGMECLKVISHHHLRTLELEVSENLEKAYFTDCPNLTSLTLVYATSLKELYIDCGNLREFTYWGSTVPSVLLFNASVDMPHTEWIIKCCEEVIDVLWFNLLREFFKQMSRWTIKLSLSIFSAMASAIPEERLGDQVGAFAAGCDVNLRLYLHENQMQNQASLLNWLLWSICPSTLTIGGYGYDSVKHLCDKLSNEHACNDKPICSKNWWDHVKDFQVECPFPEIQNNKANLPALVELYTPTGCHVSTFRFHWY